MKFGSRVLLLLFLGLAFALIPRADGDPQASAISPIEGSPADAENSGPGVRSFAQETPASPTEALGAVDFTALLGQANVDAAGALAESNEIPPASGVEASSSTITAAQPEPVESAEPSPTSITATTVAPVTTATTATTVASAVDANSIVDQMLSQVSFDWRSAFPDWEVEFRGERAGIRGLTYPGEQRIEIFVRSDDTVASLHRVFAHELGHVIDVELNSNADRDRWVEQREIDPGAPWWPSAEAPDFATGAGDFAETFAVLEAGISTRSTISGQPTSADLDLLRELMSG